MAYVDLGTTWVDYSDGQCGAGQHAWWESPNRDRSLPLQDQIYKLMLSRCSANAAGDTWIPVSQIDKTKYDVIISASSGTQLVSKGGSWEYRTSGCPAGKVRLTTGGACVDPPTTPTMVADPSTGVYIAPDIGLTAPPAALTREEVNAKLAADAGWLRDVTANCQAAGGTWNSATMRCDNLPHTRPENLAKACQAQGGKPQYDKSGTYVSCALATAEVWRPDPNNPGFYINPHTGQTVDKNRNPVNLDGGGPAQFGMSPGILAIAIMGVGALGYYIYKKRKGKK